MPLNVIASDDAKNKHNVKNDIDINEIEGLTPIEIDSWVDSSVTSVADIRKVLKILLKREFIGK